MPEIKPFCALKPAVHLQEQVVTRPLENYSTGEARLIASENPCSFLHLIDPELDNPYLRGTRQELIFKKISENLEGFIEHNYLVKQQQPAIYIYQVSHDGLLQTGIWTLTNISDYLENRIKKHESTVERRERLLADYLQQTGLDANPVLVTYHPDALVEQLTTKYIKQKPDLDFVFKDDTVHKVWAITDAGDIEAIVKAFAKMPVVYIADGHHRAASMAKMGLQKQALNAGKHNGTELYNYFSTVYMNTREVKVLEFNRLVRDLGALGREAFITAISASFEVEKSSEMVQPALHKIGMYLKGQWYVLRPNPELYNENDPVEVLDVSILQNFILGPVLNINDPRTDARITFEGGRTPIQALQTKVDNELFAVAFVLYPTSVEQVIAVADAGGVMPPKSTWVEPKFLVGLLTSFFN
ncbi:DUF1015 domain-containing protein [Pedobacter africanus]|uniref:Uncharacterized conserved protein, DUF1015 family n=1 Tax=Pedobacter africanus TaxID=151894 RepID=A0A1W2DEB5_9SPHI|nr:DUF1015 domain-containing protein [Pedobacter africanus]SMC95386.1 Uncharacterized conserved protein, DUF1015 family [Pedobacter africanus]